LSNNSVIEKSGKILDALLKFDREDPSKITMQQILDEIFDYERKRSDTNFERDVSDTIPTQQQDERV
jgi:hypothetical protein